MKKPQSNRKSGTARNRKVSSKRVKQIQSVFDRMGIGDSVARERVRPSFSPDPEHVLHYRIVLAGSTLQ